MSSHEILHYINYFGKASMILIKDDNPRNKEFLEKFLYSIVILSNANDKVIEHEMKLIDDSFHEARQLIEFDKKYRSHK